ncbi:MAG: hypothetical protein P4L27_02205, partial [Ignavibacteriaceae bacterium]|nr:hypothetical protein [Ignavibacteriaceae bacterium]
FGGHRIEGIGDKHVPWIHNVKNMDMVIDIDDNDCIEVMRLFNEDEGKKYLENNGLNSKFVETLKTAGISGIANVLSAIKMAKYYELNENKVIFTILTDSMDLYGSRLKEENDKQGKFTHDNAVISFHKSIMGANTADMLELDYNAKKRIHNLKYFTWIEQQGKELSELNAQWYDDEYWSKTAAQGSEIDKLIIEFNKDIN